MNAALAAGQTQSFTYDAVGNRTNATINAASTSYTYPGTSHKLSSLSGATTRSFTYDNTGSVTASAAITYTYDGRGRMKQAGSTTYLVNGLGQRVKKAGAGEVYFAYDEAGHLIGEYDANGATIQETIWLGDIPVAVVKPNGGSFTVYYVWSDHLNTPRLITDASNNSRWEWGHNDPFGNNAANENPGGLGQFAFNLRFPGQYYDTETGLHYNYFRDYDPRIGRYLQSDPIGLRGGISTFAYVNSTPLTKIDLFGLWSGAAHDALIDAAFPGFSSEERAAIKQGSRWYDLTSQFAGDSYGHAMRAPGQSREDARRMACDFITKNLANFQNGKDLPTKWMRLGAFRALGRALHPVMDSSSPLHENWQVWEPRFLTDIHNPLAQQYQHGNNSLEDLGHLTPHLKNVTVERMRRALQTMDCSCLK